PNPKIQALDHLILSVLTCRHTLRISPWQTFLSGRRLPLPISLHSTVNVFWQTSMLSFEARFVPRLRKPTSPTTCHLCIRFHYRVAKKRSQRMSFAEQCGHIALT